MGERSEKDACGHTSFHKKEEEKKGMILRQGSISAFDLSTIQPFTALSFHFCLLLTPYQIVEVEIEVHVDVGIVDVGKIVV